MKEIRRKIPKQLLNPTGGYLAGYAYTLNPYAGCSFACSYCYVRKLPVALFRGEEWGKWVDIKEQAADILRKELSRAKMKKKPVTLFMSSSTDPYQPVEYKEKLTRSLLEVMVQEPPHFLFVQTRSPLIVRDIDLFLQLKDRILISITIETDLEPIRKAFTPSAPPIPARIKALKSLKKAGLPVQAAISPLLPSSPQFPMSIASLVDRICLDDFFMGDGSKGRRTEQLGIEKLYHELDLQDWYDPSACLMMWEKLKKMFPERQIFLSQEGFHPPSI